MTRRELIIEAPGQRSWFLRWRDRCLTVLLWAAWSRPVDAIARLGVGTGRLEGGLDWDTFGRDVGEASTTAGILIALLYAWGVYRRYGVPRRLTRPGV